MNAKWFKNMIATIGNFFGWLDVESPTSDQFYLKIESLIDNVDDVDLRRFTILAPEGKKLSFHIGQSGTSTDGIHTNIDMPGVCRLEAILLLRLLWTNDDDPRQRTIRRFLKFQRERGFSIETDFNAPGIETLAGIVQIHVQSGRYPIGMPLVAGTVQGSSLVVSVE